MRCGEGTGGSAHRVWREINEKTIMEAVNERRLGAAAMDWT